MIQSRKLRLQDRADAKRFIDFPFELYAHNDQWVPPLVSGVRKTLNRSKHPFYRHSQAEFFVAEDERGQMLGRIAVLANRHYNDYHKSRTAFFCYFDTVDDVHVAQRLFEAADAWARDHDLDTLIGPKGFLRSDGMGILIEGFEHRAAPGIPYNYAYYQELMDALGFEKEIDYLSGYVEGDYDLPARFYQIAERVKERSGFWVKSFDSKRELRRWAPQIQRVNNEAFTEVWGYYPLDDAETRMISQQLLTIADPRMLKLVMKGDEVAGFAFVYPDISAALQDIRGRLWPFGWIKLLREFKRTRRLSANGVGLLPKYQGLGANAVLYTELLKTLKSREFDFCDVAQVAENNQKSLGDMMAGGVRWYKRHRIYRRSI
jgi:ribosomal protein S18 acetylase RimI-like enzyme